MSCLCRNGCSLAYRTSGRGFRAVALCLAKIEPFYWPSDSSSTEILLLTVLLSVFSRQMQAISQGLHLNNFAWVHPCRLHYVYIRFNPSNGAWDHAVNILNIHITTSYMHNTFKALQITMHVCLAGVLKLPIDCLGHSATGLLMF